MDDKTNPGDKDRTKRQGIGKSSRAANTSEEQPSYAFKTKDPLCHAHCLKSNAGLQTDANAASREAQWIPDTKEYPEQLHTLSLTMGTTFGNRCRRMGSHHTSMYTEGTQPFAWYSHHLQSCMEVSRWECSWKKQDTLISFAILEHDCLQS